MKSISTKGGVEGGVLLIREGCETFLPSSTVELCVHLLSQLVHHQLFQVSLCIYSM